MSSSAVEPIILRWVRVRIYLADILGEHASGCFRMTQKTHARVRVGSAVRAARERFLGEEKPEGSAYGERKASPAVAYNSSRRCYP